MNIISFRVPTHCYRADACPWGIGGYSSNGRAWRWELPENLRWRATLNMLEFIASTFGPWIDLIENNLPPLSCVLSMTDSTTTNGWLRKTNFVDDDTTEYAPHSACKLDLARAHATRLLQNNIKEYSQWFPGKLNHVADSLSRDFHLTDTEQTNLLISCVPKQLPPAFAIAPLPPEIVSFISAWLLRMPARMPSREVRTRSGLRPGLDGVTSSPPLKSAMTRSLTPLSTLTAPNSSPALPNQSDKPTILDALTASWLRQQSELPWTMWLRPFGTTSGQILESTKEASLHAFYRDSTQAIRKRTSQLNNKRLSQPASSAN